VLEDLTARRRLIREGPAPCQCRGAYFSGIAVRRCKVPPANRASAYPRFVVEGRRLNPVEPVAGTMAPPGPRHFSPRLKLLIIEQRVSSQGGCGWRSRSRRQGALTPGSCRQRPAPSPYSAKRYLFLLGKDEGIHSQATQEACGSSSIRRIFVMRQRALLGGIGEVLKPSNRDTLHRLPSRTACRGVPARRALQLASACGVLVVAGGPAAVTPTTNCRPAGRQTLATLSASSIHPRSGHSGRKAWVYARLPSRS